MPSESPSLGLTLQWTALSIAANIWHVLDVPTNSPADLAGLLPYGDYILGSPEGALHGEAGLGELVEDFIGRPMRLWVYNIEFDVTREVTVQPSRDWGGQGALGCVMGHGALHRLPAPLSEPISAPGETMFDGVAGKVVESGLNEKSGDVSGIIVPAELPAAPATLLSTTLSPPPSGPPIGAPRSVKKKDRHHKPNNFMDDYLKEEEDKSRELDRAPSGRSTPAPPPPKAGGPPPAVVSRPAEASTEDTAPVEPQPQAS